MPTVRIAATKSVGLQILSAFFLIASTGCHQTQSRPQQQLKIFIHAKKYAFIPNEVWLKKYQSVVLVLVSDDVIHGLSVKGLGIRASAPRDRPAEMVVTPTQIGDFPGVCSVYCGSGHRDMGFVIHVID